MSRSITTSLQTWSTWSRHGIPRLPYPLFALLAEPCRFVPSLFSLHHVTTDSSPTPLTELNSTLADLTETETQDASVSHALAVRLAASQGNYAKFFRLFNAAPKMGGYLMDHFVPRERVKALVTMTKACVLISFPLSLSLRRRRNDADDSENAVINNFLSLSSFHN